MLRSVAHEKTAPVVFVQQVARSSGERGQRPFGIRGEVGRPRRDGRGGNTEEQHAAGEDHRARGPRNERRGPRGAADGRGEAGRDERRQHDAPEDRVPLDGESEEAEWHDKSRPEERRTKTRRDPLEAEHERDRERAEQHRRHHDPRAGKYIQRTLLHDIGARAGRVTEPRGDGTGPCGIRERREHRHDERHEQRSSRGADSDEATLDHEDRDKHEPRGERSVEVCPEEKDRREEREPARAL